MRIPCDECEKTWTIRGGAQDCPGCGAHVGVCECCKSVRFGLVAKKGLKIVLVCSDAHACLARHVAATEPRRFGRWAGNPKGVEEDKTKCGEEVPTDRKGIGKQCERKRGHGPGKRFCPWHAKRYD